MQFIKMAIYDVFTGESALGNPCGVVVLDEWLSDNALLQLARKIAQPVTSFVIESNGEFHIRWFSLEREINLCGHGSLGAGAAILIKYALNEITFKNQYGDVVIAKQNALYRITLPAWQAQACTVSTVSDWGIELAGQAIDVFSTRDLVLVLPTEESVSNFVPDDELIAQMLDYHALIVTAQSGVQGYVLRYFAPKIGIPEDRATGSAHCSLAPYWFEQLNTETLVARQLSSSGGHFIIEKESNALINILAQVSPRANDGSSLVSLSEQASK